MVYGATGFAGRLVAEYIAERGPQSLRWGIAGRNRDKLEALRSELGERGPDEILVADAGEDRQLDALADRTRVIATTVGPYAKYGRSLVGACVRRNTHYCDLTGEVQFVRWSIDTHHEAAAEQGCRIVHCCGFDSIPSDLGVFALQRAIIARDAKPCEEIKFFLVGGDGGFSGGTVASMLNVAQEMKSKATRRILGHPYGLNPEGKRRGPDGADQMGVERDPVTGWWTGPFIMASVNTRVVRRSNALLDDLYGSAFKYGEVMKFGRGLAGLARASAFAGGLGAFMGGVAWAPTRRLLARSVLPKPGEGPSREKIERGFFKIILSARNGNSEVGRAVVNGRRDPGYGATACMLSESALCLAFDALEGGGALTPASAMGQALIDRLNAADVHFTLDV